VLLEMNKEVNALGDEQGGEHPHGITRPSCVVVDGCSAFVLWIWGRDCESGSVVYVRETGCECRGMIVIADPTGVSCILTGIADPTGVSCILTGPEAC